jgi:hypothetical protein
MGVFTVNRIKPDDRLSLIYHLLPNPKTLGADKGLGVYFY